MIGSNRGIHQSVLFLTLAAMLLSACGVLNFSSASGPTATVEVPPPPVSTVTAVPPPTLTICLGEEPKTLYPLGALNDAALSVLAVFNEDPIASAGYASQPSILQTIPIL